MSAFGNSVKIASPKATSPQCTVPLTATVHCTALNAPYACYDPALKALRTRLEAAGKPFKVAIIAVARILRTQLNAIVRENRNYVPSYPAEHQLL